MFNLRGYKWYAIESSRAFFCTTIHPIAFNKFTHLQSMEKGKIARLTDRGFGFIARESGDKDLFFHSNELQGVEFNDLKEGDEVEFEVAEGPKGPNATKVSRVA